MRSHDWWARVERLLQLAAPLILGAVKNLPECMAELHQNSDLPSVLLCFHMTNTNFQKINILNLAVILNWLSPILTNVWLPHVACSLSVPPLKHGTHRWFGKSKKIWETSLSQNDTVTVTTSGSVTKLTLLFFLIFLKKLFCFNSKNSLWVWKLAWQYLSLLRRSCSFEIHPIEETKTLEGQLSRHRAVVNKNRTFQNRDKLNPL